MGARILVFDIETAPVLSHVWALFDQNVALNQIERDWFVMAWAAKWVGEPKMFYLDQRGAKDIENDKAILLRLWDLLDAADVVLTQNGMAFDEKKVNARFIIHGMKPPSPYKHIDTRMLAKKRFAFTSTKLEYLSEKLCPEQKKSQHKKYPGFELWKGCLAGKLDAWKEMERYNKQDVLATEALYQKLAPWGVGVKLQAYTASSAFACHCGSHDLTKRGYKFTDTGKFQQYRCNKCGAWSHTRGEANNLLSKEKKGSLRSP